MRIATITTLTLLAAWAPAGAQAPSPGGAAAPVPAHVTGVSCLSSCAALDAARPGSTVRIAGSHLDATTKVVFRGARGAADDRTVAPLRVTPGAVDVKVPTAAASGPVVLRDPAGTASNPSPALQIDSGPTQMAKSGSTPPVDVQVSARRAFFDGRRPVSLRYLVGGTSPVGVTIQLVQATDQHAVATWKRAGVQPGAAQTVRWNGMDAKTKRSAARGRYEFRVFTSDDAAHAAQTTARPTAAGSFLFLDYEFPIRGPHSFGTGEARFGAARNGHVHQGQDTFADCGTPLVAARGGVVKFAGWQGNAGNYIVIDAQGTGIDYAYMHLRQPALFKKGQKVRTGDRIGDVGDTGDATACHLHFEEWLAPGWYTGGQPRDPLPDLRAWDKFS